VVSVDVDTIRAPQRCPRILIGDIARLIKNPRTDEIEGFYLDLIGDRGLITVWLSDNPRNLTIIFGEDGFRVRRSALEPGQRVRVRGKLMSGGDLTASVVIIGDVLNVKGTAANRVVDSIFPLNLDPGQVLTGTQVPIEITTATLILVGCDEEVGEDAIQRGRRARVIGKYDRDLDVLRAITIFLESHRIIGDLTDIARADNGVNLTIVDDEAIEHFVYLPQETPVYLQGDGEVELRLLNQLITNCGSKRVTVELDPEIPEPTAKQVRVQQEREYGEVVEIRDDRVLLLDNGKLVKIQEGARILLNTKYFDVRVYFDAIRVGDRLTLFGLSDCVGPREVQFYSFIVLIKESSTDCDDYLPSLVTDNNVHICLESGVYNKNLTVNGNNFSLFGAAGNNCADDRNWTILSGDVTINGNNATFRNIKFKGDIYKYGNNIKFNNCCFSN